MRNWLLNLKDINIWLTDKIRLDIEWRGFAFGVACLRTSPKGNQFRYMIAIGPASFMLL